MVRLLLLAALRFGKRKLRLYPRPNRRLIQASRTAPINAKPEIGFAGGGVDGAAGATGSAGAEPAAADHPRGWRHEAHAGAIAMEESRSISTAT